MRIKKLSAALMALGLVAASGLANAQMEVPDPPAGSAAPDMSEAMEGSIILAEAILSITAAFTATEIGCFGMEGSYPYSIFVDPAGNGNATYGDRTDNIKLDVDFVSTRPFMGNIYSVSSTFAATREYLNSVASMKDYLGQLAFSDKSEILISDSDLDVYEYGAPSDFDEHNIKDFWREIKSDSEDTTHVVDAGLEVITKEDYPLAKWRQLSDHTKWNNPDDDGLITVTKTRIAPNNVSECLITMTGDVGGVSGNATISGMVTVVDPDF